jgi:hypothetical protein
MANVPPLARKNLVLTDFNMAERIYDLRFAIYELKTNARVNRKSKI